jgi:hypothetical protein
MTLSKVAYNSSRVDAKALKMGDESGSLQAQALSRAIFAADAATRFFQHLHNMLAIGKDYRTLRVLLGIRFAAGAFLYGPRLFSKVRRRDVQNASVR